MSNLTNEELNLIYNWVDEVPLSRPKKNISRDFADGVLMAEILAHFIPKYVEMHNYSSANSQKQKFYNWQTLNCTNRLIFFISKRKSLQTNGFSDQ